MEVHKHPHQVTHPKKWSEYLLEFLMIFLAVTLGFIAENIHEHSLEVKATNGHLRTFRGELLHHKNVIRIYDSIYSASMLFQDSMTNIFYEKEENKDLVTTGRLFAKCKRLISVPISVGAYEQMVNSGGLKNIKNQTLKDSMSSYVSYIDRLESYNSFINNVIASIIPQLNFLEDFHDFKADGQVPRIDPYPPLTDKDRRFIVAHYRLMFIQCSSNIRSLQTLANANERLLKLVENQID
jgi:hypothetical protein